jgi:hypothetical protein
MRVKKKATVLKRKEKKRKERPKKPNFKKVVIGGDYSFY